MGPAIQAVAACAINWACVHVASPVAVFHGSVGGSVAAGEVDDLRQSARYDSTIPESGSGHKGPVRFGDQLAVVARDDSGPRGYFHDHVLSSGVV